MTDTERIAHEVYDRHSEPAQMTLHVTPAQLLEIAIATDQIPTADLYPLHNVLGEPENSSIRPSEFERFVLGLLNCLLIEFGLYFALAYFLIRC